MDRFSENLEAVPNRVYGTVGDPGATALSSITEMNKQQTLMAKAFQGGRRRRNRGGSGSGSITIPTFGAFGGSTVSPIGGNVISLKANTTLLGGKVDGLNDWYATGRRPVEGGGGKYKSRKYRKQKKNKTKKNKTKKRKSRKVKRSKK